MPRGRRPIAAAAAEVRCSFEAHRPKSFECSSIAPSPLSNHCEASTSRAGFLRRRRHTLSCSFSRLLKIPQRKLRASDPGSSSKVYIEGPGESERERYILDSLTDGSSSCGHGGLKHVSSDSSLFTDATWRSTPPTSTFFPRQSAGGSFSSTVPPSMASQHSSSASLSAIAAALSASTTPNTLSHFFAAPSAPPSTPRLHDWHGFDSDAQVSRSEFWCVLRAGLDVHKYRVSEMLQPPPSPPPACSRLQRAGSQPVNSLKPPTHPNLQRSKSTGKVLQLKRLYREPPAVSDEGCGMVTLFLDEAGERLCWCTPGKALLRPNAAHCIFLSSICGVTVDDSGSSSSSSKRERGHSRSFGSDVSGNSSDSSTCSSSAVVPQQQQQQQQQRTARQQGTTITLHCRSRARPLKLSVDVAHIRVLLAGGFRKLAERNNALHANSVLASAQSTQQHISEQQQQLFEEAVAAATADEQEQQLYQQQYRQQQQQHARVLSGAFCAVPAMKGDLAPAVVVAAAATVAAVVVEQQQPLQHQLQQQTAVALSH
jgi:hypothetical protein